MTSTKPTRSRKEVTNEHVATQDQESSRNPSEVKKDEDSPAQDTNTIIVEEYIQQYAPADAFGPGVIIQTTADIINNLADMADLDHDEVNAVLIREGYRPGRNNSGSFGWLMRKRGPRAE